MKKILTASQMKYIDDNTILQHKIPGIVLMERAAMAVVEEMCTHDFSNGKIVVVCGGGNNGADGIAVARLLHLMGKTVSILLLNEITDKKSQIYAQYEIAMSYGVRFEGELSVLDKCDVIVDAIFGIGLSRNVEGIFEAAINRINDSAAKVVSVDIPSGLDATSGAVLNVCVHADLTVTFAYEKRGFYFKESFEYVGKLICKSVGIYEENLEMKNTLQALEKNDLQNLPRRKENVHKGDCGKVLIIAGNEDMSGAAYLAAKSAMVTGCGIVKVYTAKSNVQIIHTLCPEAIVIGFDSIDRNQIHELCDWADAILVGPGLGTDDLAKDIFVETMKSSTVPTVIDADALTILSKDKNLYNIIHKDCIITPHFGEMSRLTGKSISEIKDDTIKCATLFANEKSVVCLLKDHRTIVASPFSAIYINLSGNEGMATAGSGDCLAGIIVSLLAQGTDCQCAAAYGAYIHGMAGDIMVKCKGIRGLLATDIIEGIVKVFMQ